MRVKLIFAIVLTLIGLAQLWQAGVHYGQEQCNESKEPTK